MYVKDESRDYEGKLSIVLDHYFVLTIARYLYVGTFFTNVLSHKRTSPQSK